MDDHWKISVVDAARASNRLVGVDLSYRFTTGMGQLRERFHGGELGGRVRHEPRYRPWV